MRIIKHGKYYKEDFIHECVNCKCVFEVENDDLVLKYSSILKENIFYFKCPECGHLYDAKGDEDE